MKKARPSKTIINIVLFLLSVIWLMPIIISLYGAAKGRIEYNTTDIWALPKTWVYGDNMRYIQQNFGAFTAMLSSFLYALCGATGAVFFAILAAYGLTHLPLKRKMFWFLVIYSGTIFPFQLYLIPIFRAYNILNLYNTRLGMILFYMAICIPFAMFVMRNFFTGISREVLESARIDGASSLMVLLKILVPMSVAPITVVFFTQFNWCWNELMFGITFTKSINIRPVMAMISLARSGAAPALLLASLIVSVPTLALFSLLQKNMETGLVYQSK
jgi:multiple sugar transport system permease protein